MLYKNITGFWLGLTQFVPQQPTWLLLPLDGTKPHTEPTQILFVKSICVGSALVLFTKAPGKLDLKAVSFVCQSLNL